MKAHITDNFDLVLRWEDDARCELVWSACSDCEFEVIAKLWFAPALNYQGPTRLEFSTTCYAHALRAFANELDDFVAGRKTSAEYCGSVDMTLRMREQRGQADFADMTVLVCDLKYEMIRSVDRVACDSQLEVILGKAEDPKGTAKAIREVLASLKMEDS